MVKTRAEVEYYKQNWMADPCWDLEDDPDFAEYKDELYNFRLEKEAEWKEKASKKLWLQSCKMGCGENLILAEYLIKLENRIEWLVERLDAKEGY